MRFTTHPDVYLEILTIKLAEIGRQVGAAQPVAPTAEASAVPQTAASSSELTSLQHEVDQLRNTVKQLEQAPVAAKPAAAKPRTTKAAPAKEVNLAKIYPVLGSATREKLNQLQEVWPDLLDTLSITQRAVMKVSQPVAAADSGVIVAFDYSFLYQRATTDHELTDALENGLDRMIGTALPVVFVPKDDWPTIRKNYLTDHREELQNNAESPEPAKPAPNPVVTKAEELFGKDVVDVKND